MDDRSKVLKFGGFRWDGIPVREYKTGDVPYRDVTRQTLLGEGAGEEPFNFVTRYFEIQPGGYSTLERHQHPHAVVVIRGRGRVTLGGTSYDCAPPRVSCASARPPMPARWRWRWESRWRRGWARPRSAPGCATTTRTTGRPSSPMSPTRPTPRGATSGSKPWVLCSPSCPGISRSGRCFASL